MPEAIRKHFAEKYALIKLKMHPAWYTDGLGRVTRFRAEIWRSQSAEEVGRLLAPWRGGRAGAL